MSQTTEIQIQNQNGLSFRTKLNQMLSALNTVFAGTTAPTVTEAGMLWMDTSVSPNVLKRRNSSDTAWEVCPVVEGAIHVAAGKSTPANNDEFAIVDSASGNILKKILWSEIKTELLKGGNLTGPFNANSGGTLASASTVNIGAATGEYITISGTTTITAFDTVQAGTMREVRFSGALTLTHNATSLILPTSANITTAAGDCATFRSEGGGNWRCVKYQRADGSPLVGAGGGAMQGNFSNLKLSATGTNASITITADSVTVYDSTGVKYKTLRNVSEALNTAGSGVNGLDTGTLAASTWYYVHIIAKEDGTTDSLLSLNATAPTLPATYLYSARAGTIRTDGTVNKYPLSFVQAGRRVRYKVSAGSNVAALIALASGAAGNVSTPTYVSIAVSGTVPPTAASITLFAFNTAVASSVIVAPNNSYGPAGSATNPAPIGASASSNGGTFYGPTDLLLESNNIYWASNNAGNYLYCYGWEDNL